MATSSAASIVFYDIPSKLPIICWSPNLWKIRYALNFKGIPYTTVWVEYPDVEAQCKELGGAPTTTKPDGSGRPHYTLPMIYDQSTGAVVTDSMNIVTYLDATYPSLPRLMSPNTAGLQHAFDAAANALMTPIYPYILPGAYKILNPSSAEYFGRTRKAKWGKPLEELTPRGAADEIEWKKLKDGFGKIDQWIRVNGDGGKGKYLMGETISYADMWIGSFVQWDDVKTWHEGRWAGLLKDLEMYETV
ncbi:hypothetical protein FB45DRAFT_934725 [Roridomyces roridus]|uniref:GST N-terminal domain-containing protein n=1 Tax=Roridomyces roridus TaxID=1738132 RepID=A0AAD7FFC9_9AGAR|nr:hypothetical protein FB45DRAFT_934725 [Roridomyces roridus]